jgi:exosortase
MARVTAAPTILLAGSFSVYKSLLSALGFKLQELTAVGASTIVAGVGVPVHRADIDIFVGRMHFTVVQGCSGMDSLLALLGLGLLVVSVLDLPLLIRPLLLLATVPIALAANTARVVAVLLLSGPVGDAVTRAPLHELLSGSVFLVAIVMFWLFVLALRCVPRQFAALSL